MMRYFTLLLLVLASAGFASRTLNAQQFTWQQGAGDTTLWSNSSNWSGGAPGSSGTGLLVFDPTQFGNTTSTNNLTNFTATGITFDHTAGAANYTLNGNQITLQGNITTIIDTDGLFANRTHTLSLGMVLNGDRTINTADRTRVIISGSILNDGTNRNLSKTGLGTLELTGSQTNAGSFTLGSGATGGGILSLGNNSALGSGTLSVTGTGSVVELQNGISIANNMTFGNSGDNKTLRLQTGATSGQVSGAITISESGGNDFDVDSNGGTLTLSGQVTGSGGAGVNKIGTGTVVLSNGTNNYSGPTNIAAGTLAGTGANAFGDTTGISIAGSGTLSLRGDNSTSFVRSSNGVAYNLTTTANGATINVDRATVAGTAAKTMTVGNLGTTSTAATYQVNFTGDNNTSLAIGTMTGAASTATGTVTVSNNIIGGGTLTIGGYNSANTSGEETLTFSGTGNTTVSGAITPSATTLSLTKNGTGTLTLNGSNTYTGNTLITAGTLVAGNNSALGTAGNVTIQNSNSRLELADGVTINRALTISDTGNLKTLALQSGATSAQYSGAITNNETTASDFQVSVGTSGTLTLSGGVGGNALTKTGDGTLVMSGANNYSGTTQINGGTLQLGNGGASGSLSTGGSINVATGAAFSVNQSDIVTQGTDFSSSAITGAGGFTQAGSGTTILTQNNSYTGATNVTAGTLRINGNQSAATGAVTVGSGATLGGIGTVGGATTIQSGGSHGPGNSPGIQTFAAGLTYNTGANVKWELIANTSALADRGTLFDGINVTGGTLTINPGVTSNLIFNGSQNGGVSSVNWLDSFWNANQSWLVYDNANIPSLLSGSIFGTVNLTGDMNGILLSSVRSGAGFSWSTSGNDVLLNYTAAAIAVPEPGTFGAMCVAGLVGAWRLGRRRKEQPSA